ncbi:hypothetical protein [Myceligenerans crystallogenes]|uniref:Lipoprotein n=1 Tax=Myceligenerans crystallogenes TaxID=316335 RepID=A0ABP4ZGH3_9MICO
MRTTRRRRPVALLAVAALAAALAACTSTANAGSTPSPKSYATLQEMIADADLVVRAVPDPATEETVVDTIPWTRTPVSVKETILGTAESGNILVSQIGTAAQPPAAGLPEILQAGRTYVLVLARTGDSTYDVVGPGVWWNESGSAAELHVTDGVVDERIPHSTTMEELVVKVREHAGELGSGEG